MTLGEALELRHEADANIVKIRKDYPYTHAYILGRFEAILAYAISGRSKDAIEMLSNMKSETI